MHKRTQIHQALVQVRQNTLRLFERLDQEQIIRQIDPEFSPIGWHLGHIAFTEANWILTKCAGISKSCLFLGLSKDLEIDPSFFQNYDRLFAADGLPKSARTSLPTLSQLYEYADQVRVRVLAYLASAPLEKAQEWLWYWLIQHETQHCETIALLLQLGNIKNNQAIAPNSQPKNPGLNNPALNIDLSEMVNIAAGEFWQGCDQVFAQDNERPKHLVFVPQFYLDRYPVTVGQYRHFIAAGGYQQPKYWSEAGWQWLQQQPEAIAAPTYWPKSWQGAQDFEPVCGVSWYEADAYARYVGKRLPTESEWEKAATMPVDTRKIGQYNHNFELGQVALVNSYPPNAYGCFDLLGNVWEWTASQFQPYPDFQSFPYPGYSANYFDSQHYVLRGGSWATSTWGIRPSFRNWYHPHVRQVLAGFRCAS